MAKSINSDLIRGNINTIILKALFERDRYGYDIIKEIEIKSHGQYILKQPTLYSCLKRLESQGLIESYWGEPSANGVNRKYYRLTDDGKEIFKQNQDEYEYSRTIIDRLISDNTYDLSSLEPVSATPDEDEADNGSAVAEDLSAADSKIPTKTGENTENSVAIEAENSNINNENADKAAVEEAAYEKPAPIEIFAKVDEEEPIVSNEVEEDEEPVVEPILPPPSIFVSEDADEKATPADAPVSDKESAMTRTAVPDINTSSIIDDMLIYGESSYFGRDIPYEESTSDEDDIAKKLAELEQKYRIEFMNAEENPDATEDSADSYEDELEMDESGFYKYNVGATSDPVPDEVRADAKRRLFTTGQIMSEPTRPTVAKRVAPAPSPSFDKSGVKIRSYGSMTAPIEEVGERPEIREHKDTKMEYKSQFYYRDSLLDLYRNGIMFVLLLLEVFAVYVIGKRVLGANTAYDSGLYITSIVLAFMLPVVAAIRFILNPNSTKRNDFNLRVSLIYRVVIAINVVLLTYAVNVYLKMPIGFSSEYFVTLLIPVVYAINIPVSALVFHLLKSSGKFAVKSGN